MAPNEPSKPIRRAAADDYGGPPKPYALVPFPKQRPSLKPPVGHHRYTDTGYHGTLHLSLKVKTALHVSTGVTAMGSDVNQSKVPLIKTMTRGKGDHLIIQGSSLKGCVRAVYEAITNSTLAVISNRYRQSMPSDRLPCNQKTRLCPASLLFGAMDWQGLVSFSDAECVSQQSSTGFMPSLYRPHPDRPAYSDRRGKAVGRKFYRTMRSAVDGGNRGTPVQQAGAEYTFKTTLQFLNLSSAQLGTLLVALGQDENNRMALKLGGGKPVGYGTVEISVVSAQVSQGVGDRYLQYDVPESAHLTGQPLTDFVSERIKTAHQEKLIETAQLAILSEVLAVNATEEAPVGMY